MFFEKKWWEVAQTEDEKKLFSFLSRNSKYKWRSITSVLSYMDMDAETLNKIIVPYIKSKMIYLKQTAEGTYVGYWELVKDEINQKKKVIKEIEIEDPNDI